MDIQRTVVALCGTEQITKSAIIKNLYNKILKNSHYRVKQNNIEISENSNISGIMTIQKDISPYDIRVGIDSCINYKSVDIEKFIKAGCEIIVLACLVRGKTKKLIKYLQPKVGKSKYSYIHGHKIIWAEQAYYEECDSNSQINVLNEEYENYLFSIIDNIVVGKL